MDSYSEPSSTCIIENAKAFGASLAGIASLVLLKKSPSHEVGRKPRLPVEAKFAIVLALSHEISNPELDWWDNREGGTPGNRHLISTANSLSQWLKEAFNIHGQPLPYHVEEGGIFLGLSEFPKSKLVEKAGHYELGCRCNPFPGGQVGIPPPSAYFPCKHGPAGFVKIAKRRMK